MTSLENNLAKIYQLANQEKIPARFIYSRGYRYEENINYFEKHDDIVLLNALEEIKTLIEKNYPLIDCYDLYKKVIKLSVEDIACIYLSIRKDDLDTVNVYLDAYNARVGRQEHPPFGMNENGVIPTLEAWLNQFIEDTKKDSETFENEGRYLTNLRSSITPSNTSFDQFLLRKETIVYYLYLNGRRLELKDGFDLFTTGKATQNIPIIEWLGEQPPVRYKVFEGLNLDGISINAPLNSHIIRIYYYHETSYFIGELDLYTSVLTITFTGLNKNYSPLKFERALRETLGVTIVAKDEKDLIGELYMTLPPIKLNPAYLQFVLLSAKWFRNIHVDDTRESKLHMRFRGFRGNSNYYPKGYVSTAFGVRVSFDAVTDVSGVNYQILNVSKSRSISDIISFTEFLKYLLGYYLDNNTQKEIIANFTKFIYAHFDYDGGKAQNLAVKQFYTPIKKIQLLKQVNPEMFNKGSSRLVSCEKQPIIIQADEVEAWRNLTVGDEERNVILFPPPEPGQTAKSHWYVCPDDNFPYINFRENKNGTVPFIVKCSGHGKNLGDLKKYTQVNSKNKGPSAHEAQTFKLRKYGERGVVYPSILNFLSVLEPDLDVTEIITQGTDINGYSFLESVLLATGTEMEEKRSDRLIQLKNLWNSILDEQFVAVYRQEFYDDSDPENLELRLRNLKYLDSALVKRGLEEYFGINIVIFRPAELISSTKSNINPNLIIEVPRFAEYHIHTFYPKRDSIFLIKTLGAESDQVEHPHYHYLNYVCGKEQNNKLFNLIRQANENYLWTYNASNNEMVCHLNPSDLINWIHIVTNARRNCKKQECGYSLKILSQKIDGYGKTRVVNLSLTEGAEGNKLSIITLPTSPLGAPESLEIYYTTGTIARKLFGEPTGINADGYWYKILDYEYGIFIPVSGIDEDEHTICPATPITLEQLNQESEYQRFTKFKQASKLLIDLIQWVWYIERDDNDPLDVWWSAHVKETSKSILSQKLPDDDKLNIFFPSDVSTSVQAIDAIHEWWSDIFKKGKIILNSAMNVRLKQYFEKLRRDTLGLDNKPPKYVNSLLNSNIGNFNAQQDNLLFINPSNLRKWLELKNKRKNNQIIEYVAMDQIQSEPVLVKLANGKIFMIQKLLDGSLFNTLMLCEIWKQKKINIGYEFETSEEVSDDYPPYVVYQALRGELIPIENYTQSPEFYSVINYNGTQYAAMLPLI